MLPRVCTVEGHSRFLKCGKNISDTFSWSSCATILFLTHFDAICDLLLNRRSATWNLPINFHEICYGGGMNEFCLTKDQTSPKSPPPPILPRCYPPRWRQMPTMCRSWINYATKSTDNFDSEEEIGACYV